MRSIFSFAPSTYSGAPLSFIWVPRESIFNRGNFFFKISNLPLFTPKNSIGLTVSRLIIVSLNSVTVFRLQFPAFPTASPLASISGIRIKSRFGIITFDLQDI